MAMFSEAGLVATGKIRLCSKCGERLEYNPEQGYCCPRGCGCWWPREREEKVIRENPDAVYAGGAIDFKGGKASSGRKRKKQPPKKDFSYLYNG